MTSHAARLVIKPPISSVKEANTFPSQTTIMPPPICCNCLDAKSISSSFVPHTIKLCESCEMVVAMAPFFNFKPLSTPSPMLFVKWWRSITATFNKSRSTSEWTSFVTPNSCKLKHWWIVSNLFGISSITFNISLSRHEILNDSDVNVGNFTVFSNVLVIFEFLFSPTSKTPWWTTRIPFL